MGIAIVIVAAVVVSGVVIFGIKKVSETSKHDNDNVRPDNFSSDAVSGTAKGADSISQAERKTAGDVSSPLENRNVAASISAENVRRSEMLDSSAIQVRDILRALTEVVQGVGTKTESSNAALSESKVRITNIKSSNLVEEASVLIDQIDNMINVNNTLKTELAEAQGAINEQKTVIDSLQTEVRIDSLTQLGNRMALEERIAESLGRFERYQEPFCILMIDIDHFKKINDTHGHPAGDRILKGLSAKMKATLRNSDFIGRYGGEEFCAIVVNGDLEKGKAAAENLRIAVESAKFNLGGKKLGITISIGVAGVQDADTIESLIKNADTALYRAKEFGRNMVCISE